VRRLGGARYWAPVASENAPKRPGTRAPTQPATRLPKPPSSSKLDGATELEATRQELREALEQQAATTEVLKVISRSTSDLQPVFEAILESATRLSGTTRGGIFIRDGDVLRHVAHVGLPPGRAEHLAVHPDRITMDNILGRAFLTREIVEVGDAVTDPSPEDSSPPATRPRTVLAVPMARSGEPIGVIALTRGEVRPFSPSDISLVATFADQAAIAIENVRLFNETKESLERQTAISEILRAISGSPTGVQPVLEVIATNARRFCGAEDASVLLLRDNMVTVGAHDGPIPQLLRDNMVTVEPHDGPVPSPQGGWPADRRTVSGRSIVERRTVHIADLQADPDDEYPIGKQQALELGVRTVLATPLLREGEPLGAIILRRFHVKPFTDRQIDLVRTFADQAVIAIENVRLFNETKEALERQTAISEILRVISRSPTEIQPVLDAIAENAARYCQAEYATVMLPDGPILRVVAHFGPVPLVPSPIGSFTYPIDGTSLTGRAFMERRVLRTADILAEADQYPRGAEAMRKVGSRAGLATPLLREGNAIGTISLRRREPRAFTEKQIDLLQTFADQAVIAIENVRLFNEVQEKAAQLEVANDELATASRHKSEFLANMSHELRTPLNAIIGFSDVLEQRLFGELNERQADYTQDIASSGRHLLDLVNEILDLSKVEAGRMELEPSEFALAETIRGALAFVRERAVRHRIELSEDAASDLGTVVADERKVRQVLLNLLSNAVKFTPDGGTIGVRARRRNGEVHVSVRDTGIGIAPEDLAKIFDEFQQVGKATDRSREGTGLGLTLAKRFIELHGGRIWIESEIGKGTTFTFALPDPRAAAAPA